MKLKFKCLLFLLLPVLAFADGITEYKKTITKSLTVESNASFNVSNKYGKVIFHTWNKNEIKANITITGFGKSDAQAQSNAEQVDVSMEKNNNQVVVMRTNYKPTKGSSWFSWGSNNDSKSYVNIDYDIYVPQSLAQLTVDNQFGDVIADNFSFPATLALNYCSFDIRDAEALTLKINYCDRGKIGNAKNVTVKGNYSNLNIGNIETLDGSTNYSDYNIENIKNLKVSATYSDFKIKKLGSIGGSITYSDAKVEELQQEANLKMVYSDLRVDKVAQSFKGADFQGTYSDVKLSVSRRQPFNIDAKLTYGDLKLGDLDMKNVYSEKRSSSLTYRGSANGAGDNAPKIRVQGVNTDVKIQTY